MFLLGNCLAQTSTLQIVREELKIFCPFYKRWYGICPEFKQMQDQKVNHELVLILKLRGKFKQTKAIIYFEALKIIQYLLKMIWVDIK